MRLVAAILMLFILGPVAAHAEAQMVRIELNKMEPQEAACQAFLLIENGTEDAFDSLVLDLVLFDTDGIIARRLAVDVAPLRAGRSSVKVFAMQGVACDGIGRVLVNDVLTCTASGAPRDDCFDIIEATSRTGVELMN